MNNNEFQVLLYYKYVPIKDAEQFAKDELQFCKSIGLKGRILIGDEGINGTVSGPKEATERYMDHMHAPRRPPLRPVPARDVPVGKATQAPRPPGRVLEQRRLTAHRAMCLRRSITCP